MTKPTQVRQFLNDRGLPVKNQFIITTPDGEYFQSYSTIIALIPKGHSGWKGDKNNPKIQLDANNWDYSQTTGKYRNQFLNETIDETRKKIKSGEYILADLNS